MDPWTHGPMDPWTLAYELRRRRGKIPSPEAAPITPRGSSSPGNTTVRLGRYAEAHTADRSGIARSAHASKGAAATGGIAARGQHKLVAGRWEFRRMFVPGLSRRREHGILGPWTHSWSWTCRTASAGRGPWRAIAAPA